MTILGIDPGAHGAIAVLDESGELLEVLDIPTTLETIGRTATNAPLLAGILARTHARLAFCEFVGAAHQPIAKPFKHMAAEPGHRL